MNTKYHILFLLLFLSGFSFLHARDVNFRSLTVDNGLSQISVMSIFVDENGFIWLGTRDGLNYYDGNEMVVYKPERNHTSNSIGTNIIQITGNKKGDIFVLCTEGITRYNYITETFSTLRVDKDIESIYYKDGLFAAYRNSILYYDMDKEEFSPFYSIPNINLTITSFLISGDEVWIGTSEAGVFLLKDNELSHVITTGRITSIYMDSDKYIWVGTWQHGCYSITESRITHFMYDMNNPNTIASNFVRVFTEDHNGDIWIGTFNGLSLFNKKNKQFTTYNSKEEIGGLTDLSIWSLATDHQGTVWVGTYYGGVNYFNPQHEIFTLIRSSSREMDGLSYPIVGKIVEDSQQNLWICTEGGGLNYYDRKTGAFKWYSFSKKTANLSQDNVKAFYYDEDMQIVWVGLHLGGLNKIDLKSGHVTHYQSDPDDPSTIPSNVVLDILPYREDLIIATNNGVALFSPSTGKSRKLFTNLKPDEMKYVRDMLYDRKGRLWLAVMNEGVYSYDFETDNLIKFNYILDQDSSLNSNKVYSIYLDSQDRIWIATARGINLLRPEENSITSYDSTYGLIHEWVYDVRELAPDTMLLLTNQGVAKFDVVGERFYNFNIVNSFPVKSLNEGGIHVSSDGMVYLGTVEGLLMFNKRELGFKSSPYTIQFTKLWVNGDKVEINDEKEILRQALSHTSFLKLKSKFHTFTVEYALSNFVPENKNKVMYRLDGFSSSWMDTDDQRRITFTNLNPGKYTLHIQAVDSDEEIISSRSIDIQILPHWAKSPLAYFVYFLLVVFIAYSIITSNNKRIRLRESLKYEQERLKDAEDQNNAKLQFYTNASHELRTPLTLVMGELDMLLQSPMPTPKVKEKLGTVFNNAKILSELLNELLDFRKQEQGYMKLHVKRHNFTHFIQEVFLLFKGYADDREISFDFIVGGESIEVWYDSKLMLKVVNNLLSNAFKFTRKGGSVTIELQEGDEEVILSVQDSGRGISLENQKKIFDPFYQVNSSYPVEGSGIGLTITKKIIASHHGALSVESDVNQGSKFVVKLPLGNSHFDEAQIDNDVTQSLSIGDWEEKVPVPRIDNGKHYKMLVIEDNMSLLEMLRELFSPYYHVNTALNGEEAWKKIEKDMPDIIISDVLMPVMSGTELCKRVKETIATCHIPVILLTAQADITHTIEGLRIGADDYVSKPFEPALLVSKANSLINNRSLLQEKFSKEPQISPLMLATSSIDKEIMNKVTDILEKNISNPDFSIDALATEMGMSRTILFSKIKAITAQTPNELISTVRLKRAAFLLRNNPEMNITEISESVGFNSLRYFSKCFKEKYDQTPSVFRKKK